MIVCSYYIFYDHYKLLLLYISIIYLWFFVSAIIIVKLYVNLWTNMISCSCITYGKLPFDVVYQKLVIHNDWRIFSKYTLHI